MHFYGMSLVEVERLTLSRFTMLVKCAEMLNAKAKLTDINVANFASLVETDQKSFSRTLRTAATLHMIVKVKDYREVLGNLARKLRGR